MFVSLSSVAVTANNSMQQTCWRRPLISDVRHHTMRRFATLLTALGCISSQAQADPSLVQILEATKECDETQCTFRAGKDLQFTISGIGKLSGGIVFERSFHEGDYYASIGLLHGCVIVHNGKAKPPILTEIAFVSPRSGKVYLSWQECKGK